MHNQQILLYGLELIDIEPHVREKLKLLESESEALCLQRMTDGMGLSKATRVNLRTIGLEFTRLLLSIILIMFHAYKTGNVIFYVC